jgi:serpin B
MLLARFEKQKSNANRISTQPVWLSTALLYRGKDSLSQDFMDHARHYFGLEFHEVGGDAPQSTIVAQNWDPSLPMPVIAGQNDFWITSFLHLRTTWAGNTFIGAKREKEAFTLYSGRAVQADFLKSETTTYSYAKTKDFEAIVLRCGEASILLVLPGQGAEIGQLLGSMVKNPNMFESLLQRQQGDVRLPPFHLSYDVDLREPLENMGVHRIFQNPAALFSMAPKRDGAKLKGIVQGGSIIVDEHGIRGDAATVMNGIYGGIEGPGPSPFHMLLNHPFLFLIRDNATNALLFSGVVMDPTGQ